MTCARTAVSSSPGSRALNAAAIGWCWRITAGPSDGVQLAHQDEPAGEDLKGVELPEQHLVPAAGEDRAMETDVGVGDRQRIPGVDHDLEVTEGVGDLCLGGRVGARGLEREARGIGLEDRPHARDLPGRPDRQLRDEDAAVGDDLDEPAGCQHSQRLADGPARGVQLAGERYLGQVRSG